VVHLQKEYRFAWLVVLLQKNPPLWQVEAVLNLSLLGYEVGELFFVGDLDVLQINNKLIYVGV